MNRSRLSMFVLFAAMAACSTSDASETAELLSQDSTLIAKLEKEAAPRQQTVPYACSAISVAAPRAGVNTPESAPSLTTQCRNAAPVTAGPARVRERTATARAPRSERRVAAVGGRSTHEGASGTTARHVARANGAVEPQVVASAPVEQAVPATPKRGADAASATMGGTAEPASPTSPVSGSSEVAQKGDGASGPSDVAAAPTREPAAEQATTAARRESRTQSRSQRAGIGAITGAIFGAVTGRSVKGAVIGAAAGGVLGSVVGGGIRPTPRTVRP